MRKSKSTYRFEPLSEELIAYQNGARHRIIFDKAEVPEIKAFLQKAREKRAFWLKDEGYRKVELFIVQWPGTTRFESRTEAQILERVKLLN